MTGPAGPLAGLKVIELGQLIAGPFAAKTLADFGAEVIKIETPADPNNPSRGAGDPLRKWRLLKDGTSVWWQVQSRNKRSVALDLRQAEAQEIVRRLAQDADVLIENFCPGAMKGRGLGPQVLLAANPGLVLGTDPQLGDNAGRVLRVQEIDAAIGSWADGLTVAAVLDALAQADVPAGRIYSVADIAADPHFAARGMLETVTLDDGTAVAVPGFVPKLSRTPGAYRCNARALGQYTQDVLREVGVTQAQIDALRAGRDQLSDAIRSMYCFWASPLAVPFRPFQASHLARPTISVKPGLFSALSPTLPCLYSA